MLTAVFKMKKYQTTLTNRGFVKLTSAFSHKRQRKLVAGVIISCILYIILQNNDFHNTVLSTSPSSVRLHTVKQRPLYERRVERLNRNCWKFSRRNPIDYERMWLIDQDRKTLFCSLAKVGSTFWNHVFHILRNGNESFSSPYSLEYPFYQFLQEAMTLSTNASALLKAVRNEYLKVLFVREPYSRLFSAYVDKLIQPNGYYWNVTGKYIAYRKKKRNKQNLACGHNISFEDVVEYVIHAETTVFHRDIHFAPMYQQCNICDVSYDIIGKMEYFSKDTIFYLKTIKSLNAGISLTNWTEEHNINYITEKCSEVFKIWNTTKHCMSFTRLLFRQWRAFQIVGLISTNLNFPFTGNRTDTITLREYTDIIINAYKRSGSSAKANKMEALKQAYRSVSRSTLYNLKDVLSLDFELFGYNPSPDFLFVEEPKHRIKTFNYFDFLEQSKI